MVLLEVIEMVGFILMVIINNKGDVDGRRKVHTW